ncbi:MAG: nucleotidyltransferase domain-containing protein [Deltaproteobacteria bacterium]|nr:nucleotidyltransferase domain-containing protein [Deltaproteobacteria bacterium]
MQEFFRRAPLDAAAAWLFGSTARGTARCDSDVDVAVLFAHTPTSTLAAQPFALEDELRALLGKPTQVVALNRAPVDLVHRVLRDGILVFEGDRSARVRFEVKARNEYFDLLPMLQRYRGTLAP